MPEYNDDGSEKTVQDHDAVNNVAAAASFAEIDEAHVNGDVELVAPYAVEGNDTTNFRGTSQEYRTYASEVDSPGDFDGTVADNSQEKLDALKEQAEESGTDDTPYSDLPAGSATSYAPNKLTSDEQKEAAETAQQERDEQAEKDKATQSDKPAAAPAKKATATKADESK